VDLPIVELMKIIISFGMCFHKSVRSHLHVVEIQTARQNTTSAMLKRGGALKL